VGDGLRQVTLKIIYMERHINNSKLLTVKVRSLFLQDLKAISG